MYVCMHLIKNNKTNKNINKNLINFNICTFLKCIDFLESLFRGVKSFRVKRFLFRVIRKKCMKIPSMLSGPHYYFVLTNFSC